MTVNDEIIVVGAGGHGRVVLDALLACGARVYGLLDPGLAAGSEVMGVVVLGGDHVLDSLASTRYRLANGLGANPSTVARASIHERLVRCGHRFATVIHPSAVVGRATELGDGSQIMARAVVQCGGRIGRNVVVNTAAALDHDVVIEDDAFIAPGAVLCGAVKLGRGAFIGAGAVLLPGVRIGANAVIAAGAVVCVEVPPGGVFSGVPARMHKKK
jgi:sugar O-acyltransferase (sialic acid O-acetyltransferase NeuD family)